VSAVGGPWRRGARAAVLAGLLAALAPVAPAAAQTLAIVHAHAHTMSSAGAIEDATILVRGGRIVAIGKGLAVPAGATVIDAGHRQVTPGLMSGATQLGLVEVSSAQDTVDVSAAGALGAAFDIRYGLNPNSMLIPIARADGLTRAMVFPRAAGHVPFMGLGAVIVLAPGADILDQPAAALFAALGGATAGEANQSRAAQWLLLRNALDEARHFARHRRDYRTAAGRDQLLNRIDLEALLPVLERRIPLAIFTRRESDIRQAVQLAEEYGVRVVLLGAQEAWRAAALLAERDIPVVLDPLENLPMSFDQLGARLDNAALLARAGVRVAFHASGIHMSHNAGAALREGAGVAVAHGLEWQAALEALTINPARAWGIADRYGSLEVGKSADLVIWDGDPVEPMSAPVAVIVQGVPVSLETRQTLLRDRYHPVRRDP
jgi:imidazolonepropionase-like amidohydrolase